MKVCLATILRDATGYLPLLMKQLYALDYTLRSHGDELFCSFAEGDSVDRSWQDLRAMSVDLHCRAQKMDLHGKKYGPCEDPLRFELKARMDRLAISGMPADSEILIWCESDLQWEPSTMVALINHVKEGPKVVAPWCWGPGGRHRDIWAFRTLSGKRTLNDFPFIPEDLDWTAPLIELSSVGSCMCLPASAARKVQVPSEMEWVQWCADLREKLGLKIYLAPMLGVRHP